MNPNQKFAVMTVGKTHSGKSTFAKMLHQQLPSFHIIETDPIAIFLKEYAPGLAEIRGEASGDFSKPTLKFKLFETVVDHTLEYSQNIILANSNMWAVGRKRVVDTLQNSGYTVIMVYLNPHEDVMFGRIKSAGRSTVQLSSSKDYSELLIKQRDRMTPPTAEEADHFIEITDQDQIPEIIGAIQSIVG